jgi:Predicted O-methyltransferase
MGREIPGVKPSNANKSSTDHISVSKTSVDGRKNKKVQMRYITHDSVYLCLQNNLIKLIRLINSTSILELGFGGVQTAVKVAEKYSKKTVTVVNTDAEMTNQANELVHSKKLTNITIMHDDVENFVKNKNKLGEFDFIYLLYNFHHIHDSSDKKREKVDFLINCYDNMKSGSYLCIADVFLPESCQEERLVTDRSLKALYDQRAKETEALTFWNDLKGVDYDEVHAAVKDARDSGQRELKSLVNIKTKANEYLVKKSWVVENAENGKFSVLINEDVNNIGDAILLLKKI